MLLLLMYYREYRIFFYISKSYGISEMQCRRIITQTEKMLMQSSLFHLPGKKALHQSDSSFEVTVTDAGGHPAERPEKNRQNINQAKRSGTLKKAKPQKGIWLETEPHCCHF